MDYGILVHGLRQRHVGRDGGWFERMTDTVAGTWPVPTDSTSTPCAEHGLGITGRPFYFYALRADENFGLVVFLLREVEGVNWPPGARGATPFDSGGLWSGEIVTDPSLNEGGRRSFFEAHDVPLTDWRLHFETYIGTRYKTVADYVCGRVPAIGTLPPDSGPAIVMEVGKDPRAWTWEVRVPRQLVARHLKLRAVCISEKNRKSYLDWLWRCSSLTTGESSKIDKWIQDHAIIPSLGSSEADGAAEWILQEVVQ